MFKVSKLAIGLGFFVVVSLFVAYQVSASGWQLPEFIKKLLPFSNTQEIPSSTQAVSLHDSQTLITDQAEILGLITEAVESKFSTYQPVTPQAIQYISTLSLSDVTKNRLLFVNGVSTITTMEAGNSGQYLSSRGSANSPTWVDAGSLSSLAFSSVTSGTNSTGNLVIGSGSSLTYSGGSGTSGVINANQLLGGSWASPGSIGSSSPGTGAFTTLTAVGGATPFTVGTNGPFQILDSGRVELTFDGDAGYLSSSGGALFLNNTNNVGTGLGIYSNAGTEALGNMINVKVDNVDYNQAAFYMNYDGLSNAVEIVSNSSDSSSNALAVTGNNINDSTLGIIGYELSKGTIKVTHNRPTGGNDQNASGLSIDLKGSGTRAQGVYVDSTESGGTLGNLLRLRNESIDKFVVNYQGNVTFTGNMVQGANGTSTTYTKYGSTAGDEFFVGTNASFRVQRSASNSEAFRVQISGDSNGRWVGTSDGRLRWGDGTNASDVTLRRGGVGYLLLEGGININNDNGDYDTVIKGMTDSNLLYVDASADSVGIGTSSPTAGLHINKNTGSNPGLLVNQLGSADLLSLQTGGVARFAVNNAGNLVSVAGAGWRPTADATTGLQIQNSAGTGFVTFDTTNQRVGIGTALPGAPLHVVGGDIWLENNQALRIKDSGGSARSVLAYTSGNNVQLYNYASSGILQIGLNNVSNTAGNIRFFTGSNTERVRIDPAGLGVGATTFGTSAVNVLAIASSTAPTTSITDGAQLFAVDVAGSHELRVRDEAGNITTLSPHNFSLIPEGKSETLAWSFYSERGDQAINVDMTHALRLLESLTGQKLVYTKNLSSDSSQVTATSLDVAELDWGNEFAKHYVEPELQAQLQEVLYKSELAEHVTFGDQVWKFISQVVFTARTTFLATVEFMGKVSFKGPLEVGQNTAGQVVVPAGSTLVEVKFRTPYEDSPLVYLTPQKAMTAGYGVVNVSREAFQIQLTESVSQDLPFNWWAVLGGGGEDQVQVIQTGEVAGEATQVKEILASPDPVVTPGPETQTPVPLEQIGAVATISATPSASQKE